MRMWIDTEFNGFKGELISIAIVAEDGAEFYEILDVNERLDPWVFRNVIPVLNSHRPDKDNRFGVHFPRTPISRSYVQNNLRAFLFGYKKVHLIADWPEDIALFCRLLLTEKPGERIDTPVLTMEITREDYVSAVPHNALEDARAMRQGTLGPVGPKVSS